MGRFQLTPGGRRIQWAINSSIPTDRGALDVRHEWHDPARDRADRRSIFSMLNYGSRPGRNDSMTTEISMAKPPMDSDNVPAPLDRPRPDSPSGGGETTF